MATSQRTGRTKRSFGFRQYMCFGQEIVEISLGRLSPRTSDALRPFLVTLAARYSPLDVDTFSSRDTSIPAFFAKACAAGVGWPSLYATASEGPVTCSSISDCVAATPDAITAMRRGESKQLTSPPLNRSRVRS